MKIHKTAEEATACVKSNQTVFVHGGAATPCALLNGLVMHGSRLRNVTLMHLHTEGPCGYVGESHRKSFRVLNLFVGKPLRDALDYDVVDYLPCFLSEIPNFFRSKRVPVDVALIHVSPPDPHGFCTLGVSVDVARAAVDVAPTIIAQMNPHMPRVHGDGFIHTSQIHHAFECASPLPEIVPETLTSEDVQLGKNVASLIEDGATLQTGIGAVPNAVLQALKGHKHLGVHTEMWTDGMLDLLKCGAIDNSKKSVHRGKTVSGFIMGTKKVYDFINDNPSVVQLDIAYVNDPRVISRNAKVAAVNSAVEVDLTGQVCADSIGTRIISGVGGQMDFIRGASLSPGGKPIIALTSRTSKGVSRITSQLKPGAGVVTTRAHVHYIVTEHGIADLYGQPVGERAKRLASIAHPDDRDRLLREFRDQRIS